MSDQIQTIVLALAENKIDKKPTVAEMTKLVELDKVTGEELNAAWKQYQESKNTDPVDGVFVKAVPGFDGFRRAGFAFTEEGFGIAFSALTEDQLEYLEAEKKLIVQHVTFSHTDKFHK